MKRLLLLLLLLPALAQDGTVHENAAKGAMSRRDYVTAVKEFELAARDYQAAGNNFSLFQVLLQLGQAKNKARDMAGANAAYDQALKLARQIKNPSFEADAENGLGEVLFEQSNWSEASRHFTAALMLARKANLPDDERGALVNLGAAALNMRQIPAAIKYYNDGLALARKSGDPLAQIDLLFRLGKAKLVSNDYKGAGAAYEEAAQIAHKSGDRGNEAASYHNLSLVYEAARDPVKAAEYKQKAEALK